MSFSDCLRPSTSATQSAVNNPPSGHQKYRDHVAVRFHPFRSLAFQSPRSCGARSRRCGNRRIADLRAAVRGRSDGHRLLARGAGADPDLHRLAAEEGCWPQTAKPCRLRHAGSAGRDAGARPCRLAPFSHHDLGRQRDAASQSRACFRHADRRPVFQGENQWNLCAGAAPGACWSRYSERRSGGAR